MFSAAEHVSHGKALFQLDTHYHYDFCFPATEHTCSVCSKTFPKRHFLNHHQRTHHEERVPLPCNYEGCDRVYWEKRNLTAHIKRYHNAQRFACDQPSCGKTFASKVWVVLLSTITSELCLVTSEFCLVTSELCLVTSEFYLVTSELSCYL